MTLLFAIKVILSVIAVLFVSYGLLHEDKVVAFEDAVIRLIKKKIYLHKRRKALEKRRQQGRTSTVYVRPQYETPVRRQAPAAERRRVA